MPWLHIKIPTLPEHTNALEDAMLLAGCQAVTLVDTEDQPVFEPIRGTTPLWQHTTIQGLFDHEMDANTLKERLQDAIQAQHIETLGPIVTEILEDKDWERSWMDNFKPIACGDRLWICPSWLEPPDPTAINLRLDPGLAFGTGTHPTTFLCLTWLDQNTRPGDTVLDYGCGSGILGLAALLLGAERMDGLDIDPQALDATRANADNNGIDPACFRVMLDDRKLDPEYNLVVANILAGPLCDLAPSICNRLKPGGKIALSGILEHQADNVLAAYTPWVDFESRASHHGWVRLNGQRRQ